MQTKIFSQNQIPQAASLLRQGELVAFPTETVFGLGAIANQNDAVMNVFAAKGRPADNPLIVHVASIEQVGEVVSQLTPTAVKLMENFWPGPLTLVLPVKEGALAEAVTAGHDTVGVRMPNHPLTLQLIEETGFPLVGPSANVSGKPSPTQVKHVLHDFQGKIAGVLQDTNETTEIGLESTVVRPGDGNVEILRLGAVTASMFEKLGIQAEIISEREQLAQPSIQSPGVKYRHYSPEQPVVMVTYPKDMEEWEEILTRERKKIGLIADEKIIKKFKNFPNVEAVFSLGEVGDAESFSQHFYAGLRDIEATNCEIIYVQALKEKESTLAFLNRLSKASSFVL